jgi:acyl-CoA thioesterase
MSTTPATRTPQQIAEAVRAHMVAHDHAPRMLGIEVASIGPGSATTTMTVRDDMLNGHAICHGGLIATLADTCFAYACNAYDEVTVAAGFSVDLLAPARVGDVLTASAGEVAKGGRTGLYDIVVTNQRDERVAMFRGRSYTMKGKPVVPADAAP